MFIVYCILIRYRKYICSCGKSSYRLKKYFEGIRNIKVHSYNSSIIGGTRASLFFSPTMTHDQNFLFVYIHEFKTEPVPSYNTSLFVRIFYSMKLSSFVCFQLYTLAENQQKCTCNTNQKLTSQILTHTCYCCGTNIKLSIKYIVDYTSNRPCVSSRNKPEITMQKQ